MGIRKVSLSQNFTRNRNRRTNSIFILSKSFKVLCFLTILLCIKVLVEITLKAPESQVQKLLPSIDEIDDDRHSNDPIILKIKSNLIKELDGFDLDTLRSRTNATNITQLTPKTGGKPVINVIMSTFRSGSNFMEEIFQSFPGTFLHHEILMQFGSNKLDSDEISLKAVKEAVQMLHCNYSGLDKFMDVAKQTHTGILGRNKRVFHVLSDKANYSKEFLAEACQLFPIQAAKLNRLHLRFAEEILKDKTLNLRMLFLFRDPRGLINSRLVIADVMEKKFKHDSTEVMRLIERYRYFHPQELCDYFLQDLKAAKELIQKYPTRFTVVRYEDFSLNIFKEAPELFKFMGLPFHDQVRKFIEEHTENKATPGDVYSTYRNTNETVFRWLSELNWDHIDFIQQRCSDALRLGGYLKVPSKNELDGNFVPIKEAKYDIRDFFNEIDLIN